MALNDILMHIDSYPEGTPFPLIDRAVRFAGDLGGKISALAVQVQFPIKSNRVADYLIGLSRLSQEEEARSHQSCLASLAHFTEAAKAAGAYQEALLDKANLYEVSDHVAARARTRDLCVVPLAGRFDGQEEVAQNVLFNSGRPVVVFDAAAAEAAPGGGRLAVVAWDGGRSAARALADALPILRMYEAVRVLTVLNDKPDAVADLGAEAVRHLKAHGVAAAAEAVDRSGDTIGEALDRYAKAQGASLLVMGAFGHSRLREFVLGGATAHMLRAPAVPVLMSH